MNQSAITDPPWSGLISLAAWGAMPEDEPGELVDGRLVEEEVADYPHEAVVSWLSYRLTGWAEPRKGAVFGSEAKFAVAPGRGRKPDISVFFTMSRKLPRRGATEVPPDLVVEVISPSSSGGADTVGLRNTS